jgi:L-malate glycosyltransferase
MWYYAEKLKRCDMTIAIVSMIRDAWGGSEELWYQMAKKALAKGIRVIHIGYENAEKHAKIIELEKLGMIHFDRPSLLDTHTQIQRFIHLSWNYFRKTLNNPFEKLFSYKPDVLLYNGTCYSIASEKQLL